MRTAECLFPWSFRSCIRIVLEDQGIHKCETNENLTLGVIFYKYFMCFMRSFMLHFDMLPHYLEWYDGVFHTSRYLFRASPMYYTYPIGILQR